MPDGSKRSKIQNTRLRPAEAGLRSSSHTDFNHGMTRKRTETTNPQ